MENQGLRMANHPRPDVVANGEVACCICLEDASGLGAWCSDRHFVCASCLEGHIGANLERQPGADGGYPRGQLRCPFMVGMTHCVHMLPRQEVVHHENCLHAYVRGCGQMKEREEARVAPAHDGDEDRRSRVLRLLRQHVAEDIRTKKCPNPECGVAFQDFDGCLALTCHSCGCGFCGLCFTVCGQDAHEHLLTTCPVARRAAMVGQFFLSLEDWERHMERREKDALKELWGELSQALGADPQLHDGLGQGDDVVQDGDLVTLKLAGKDLYLAPIQPEAKYTTCAAVARLRPGTVAARFRVSFGTFEDKRFFRLILEDRHNYLREYKCLYAAGSGYAHFDVQSENSKQMLVTGTTLSTRLLYEKPLEFMDRNSYGYMAANFCNPVGLQDYPEAECWVEARYLHNVVDKPNYQHTWIIQRSTRA
eukprot:TRINITY_DN14765_c0_g1_i5.p1 TRINITY_DN14765_c0_g1~~TRINITY_DN14765_c0_g1_i5.p1  ORF type:complete len:423 (-),score=47.20 TRINITY_DN14765_c0_g1_i5:400-1668(-)